MKRKLAGILILVFCGICCKKNNNPSDIGNQPPPNNPVSFTLTGKIIDENGRPAQNVSINSSGKHTVTDTYGFFTITDLTSGSENAVVTAELNGYFKGVRNFIPESNSTNFVSIKLIKKDILGNISGSKGGNLYFSNGTIQFPENSFTDPQGSPFSGTANVFLAYLSPSDKDFADKMPGDLRALDTTHKITLLTSYGMVNIEIQDASGQSLKIAPGKKVKLTSYIPNAQIADAPAQMPLWYYNDSTGYWIQEGVATKIGNSYSGEVSHFTTWNFDVANGFTYIKAKFITTAGNPISYRRVVITALNGAGGEYLFSSNLTTDKGTMNALAPIIIGSRMDMYDDCGTIIYSKTLSPLVKPIDLGTITITNKPMTLVIKGMVKGCANMDLGNSSVYITFPNRVEKINPASDGTFILETVGCLSASQFNVIAVNNSTNDESPVQTFLINSQDTVNVGALIVCNNVADQFIQIIRNKDTFNYRFPEATSIFGNTTRPNQGIDSSRTNIFALTPASQFYSGIVLNHVPFQFSAPGTMSIYSVDITNADSIPDYVPTIDIPAPQMNITQYDPVGGYIAGNWEGTLHRSINYTVLYNFKINFRVKRK